MHLLVKKNTPIATKQASKAKVILYLFILTPHLIYQYPGWLAVRLKEQKAHNYIAYANLMCKGHKMFEPP